MNNEFIIILATTILVSIVAIYFKNKFSSDVNNTKRSDHEKPKDFAENDKLIILKNVRLEILKKVIIQFCNINNQNGWKVLPMLTIDKFQFKITFPYDIEFDTFCFFINYLKYPSSIGKQTYYKPDIKAWGTTKIYDKWMKPDIVNKNVMIYIPDWDDEYDNVYLTTQDNISFLMGFAIGEMTKKLDKTIMNFQKKPKDKNITKLTETINFE